MLRTVWRPGVSVVCVPLKISGNLYRVTSEAHLGCFEAVKKKSTIIHLASSKEVVTSKTYPGSLIVDLLTQAV